MSDQIEPALTPDEWDAAEIEGYAALVSASMVPMDVMTEPDRLILSRAGESVDILAEHAPAVTALLNAMLRDDDQRKITREAVADMRRTAEEFLAYLSRDYGPESNWGRVPQHFANAARVSLTFADALESYLPPTP